MIIVSQDKTKIINFQNVDEISIRDNTNTIRAYDNTWTDEQDGTILGDYRTPERAKEVLVGIMQAYVDSENYKYVNRFMETKDLNRLQKGLVYEMPAE